MTVIPERVETHEASPMTVPSLPPGDDSQATALGGGAAVEPSSIPGQRRWSWDPGRPTKLEFTEQSAGKERAPQREN